MRAEVTNRALQLLVVVGALSWCSPVARSKEIPHYRITLARPQSQSLTTDIATAHAWIRAFCSKLDCPEPIKIDIEEPWNMPRKTAAHTTQAYGGGCMLHFTEKSIQDWKVVAHEVCHCTFDYEFMTPLGWHWSVSDKEQKRRERSARMCAQRLTDGTWGKR